MNPIRVLSVLLAGGVWLSAAPAPETSIPKPPCCREGLPPAKYTDKSIYQHPGVWTSDVGSEIRLEKLRGRPQVLAMFFSNCEHSCTQIVQQLKAIDRALPAGVRTKVDFLLVTIDPDRDTTEVLHAYRAKMELPTERWTLLRGGAEDTRKLADMVGFNYVPGSARQFAHSLLVTVLNAQGEVVFQQAGLGQPTTEVVKALTRISGRSAKR